MWFLCWDERDIPTFLFQPCKGVESILLSKILFSVQSPSIFSFTTSSPPIIVMEWKFRTGFSNIRPSHGFSDPLKLCFVQSLLNGLCFSPHFSSFRKAINCSFHSLFHSLMHATRSLYFIWFLKKGNYSSVDRSVFLHFLQLLFPFISIFWMINVVGL